MNHKLDRLIQESKELGQETKKMIKAIQEALEEANQR